MSTCLASSLHADGMDEDCSPIQKEPTSIGVIMSCAFLSWRTGLEPSNRLKREQLTLFCSSSAARVNSCDGRQRWLSSTSLAGVLFRLRDRGFVCKASRCMAQRKRGLTRGVHLDHENQSKGLWDVSPVSSRLVMFPMNLHGEQMKRAAAGLLNKARVMTSWLPPASNLSLPQCFGCFNYFWTDHYQQE